MSDNTTDSYSEWRTRPLPEGNWTMRVGRKVPRNLYIEWSDGRSEPVGQVDNTALAAYIVSAVNALRIWPGEFESLQQRAMFENNIEGGVGTHIIGNSAGGDINISL